jgi:hypothetical protein
MHNHGKDSAKRHCHAYHELTRISLLHEGCGAGKKGPPGGHIIVSEKIVTGKGEVTPKQIVREWRKAWRSTLVSRGTHQRSRGHAGRG